MSLSRQRHQPSQERPKLAIAYPWQSPFLYTGFVESALNLRQPEGWDVRWFRGTGWCVARMHNHGVEQALKWGADAICLLDPDQVYEDDALERLMVRLDEGCEVVGALVPLRSFIPENGMKPFQSMAWIKKGDKQILARIDESDGDLQEVHTVGTGVLMLQSSLFSKLGKPWFFERIDQPSFNRNGGHDTRFVGRLRKELGAKIWVDTTIKVKHLEIFEIDETFTDRFPDREPVTSYAAIPEQPEGFGGWSIDYECFQEITKLMPYRGTLLELGSGPVTHKLAKCYTVYSIEDNIDYMEGLPHGIHAPISRGWYCLNNNQLPEKYDLILVDGPSNRTGSRMGFFNHRNQFNLDVPIVMDDVNRPEERAVLDLLARETGRTPKIHYGTHKDFAVL